MNKKYKLHTAPIFLALIIALWVVLPTVAQSSAALLEKGLYTEQTVGDLNAAIEIYTKIVESSKANRPHAAQAHFRLAMCHLKKGDETEARAALEELIQSFPEQEGLITQARKQLAAVQPALALEAAPWADGEYLEYRITLPTGKALGTIYQMAESAVIDGVDAWRLELRKFFTNSSDNYGVSQVLVNRRTQRPIRSTFRHGVLGNANASYGLDGVHITGGETDTHIDSDQTIYDNEQSMHLVRTLPLERGYEAEFNLLPTWTGKVIEAGVKVGGKETCRVPAGEFECLEVTISLGETFWYSTSPERYLVKVRAGGVVIELAEIGRRRSEDPLPFAVEDFGFSGTLAPGWLVYEHREPGEEDSVMLRLLDPAVETISSVELDRCRGRCPSLQEMAERELAGAERRFEEFELRKESWTERTIDGRPAISFAGNYLRKGQPWVQYRVYTLADDLRVELIFRTPAKRFEGLQDVFDSMLEGLEAD